MFCLLNRTGEDHCNRICWGYVMEYYRFCCVVNGYIFFFMKNSLLSFLTFTMAQGKGVWEVRWIIEKQSWFYHPLAVITSQAWSKEANHVLPADKLSYCLRRIQRISTHSYWRKEVTFSGKREQPSHWRHLFGGRGKKKYHFYSPLYL